MKSSLTMTFRRKVTTAVTSLVVVLMTATPALAAGSSHQDQVQNIIKAQTGVTAGRAAAKETVGKLSITVGHDKAGAALESYSQRTDTNSVRMLAVVTDQSQSAVDFKLGLPAGTQVKVQPDGSVSLGTVGTVNKPWAVDANHKSLPTSYTYNAGVLTQQIDTKGAAFPVVADPWLTGGPFLYVHFSRNETFQIYNAWRLGKPTEISYVCGLLALAGVPGAIAGAVCGVYVAAIINDVNATVDYAVHAYHKRLVLRFANQFYAGSTTEYAP